MSNEKLVTVYIPTKNRLSLLKRSINSVLNQTYKKLEIIVIDDGSEDGTKRYLEDISVKDNRLIFFCNSESRGACYSRNFAINKASGYYITGLDDDDYFLENRIENLVNFFESKKFQVIYSNYILKHDGGTKKIKKKIKCTRDEILYSNHMGNQVFTLTENMKNNGGFDQSIMIWQDLDCWIRLLSTYGKAGNNDDYSYVVDVSHDTPRITVNQKYRIKNSYNIISSKNNLNYKEQKKLEIHILCRDDIVFNFGKLISFYRAGIFYMPTKVFLKKTIKKIIGVKRL